MDSLELEETVHKTFHINNLCFLPLNMLSLQGYFCVCVNIKGCIYICNLPKHD